MTLEDCRAYYRTHYHPGNMAVVVVAVPETARISGAISATSKPRSSRSPAGDGAQRGERMIFKKVSQVEAFRRLPRSGADHPDIYPLTLLSVILSVGKSWFYQELVRPDGRGTGGDSLLPGRPRTRTSWWSERWLRRNSLADLEADVWAHLERLMGEGVKPDELARAQNL
jgi:hypothetical protein